MTRENAVPFLDLIAPHRELENELHEVLHRSLSTAEFIGGPAVTKFEESFAAFCDTQFCAGVGSGTDALRFAIMAAGVKPGDVVITVPNTFIATTEAISQAGAVPRFVDIDENTYNMSVVALRSLLDRDCVRDKSGELIYVPNGRPVRAVVPVHLYGQMADMDAILEVAEGYGLMVIEDACQAHGAQYFSAKLHRWMKAGSMGRAGAFSFYPGKNLGACGEAGAVTTNDADLARKVKMLRDHGQVAKYYHDVEGYNGRLDAIQAGILSVKLTRLAMWNDKRRERAATYRELLSGCDGVVLPSEQHWSKAVYHLFVIRVGERENLRKLLAEANIGTGIHYPIPLHLQEAYRHSGYRQGDFPVTEAAAAEILSLPMYPELTAAMQAKVTEAVARGLSGAGSYAIQSYVSA